MLAGAVVVTDDSTYMNRTFTDGKELVLFKRTELANLPERICSLFGHLDCAQEMANCGYEAAQSYHTWKSRVEYIIECFL
jgi:spore maturation protein CgeB